MLLALYFVVALGTLLAWAARGVYPIAGDAPHALVMARGISEDFPLDQQPVYEAELANPVIFAQTMSPLDPSLSPMNTQTVAGESGLYSIHSPGLGLLLAAPLAIGGVLGSKVALIAIGAMVVPLTWLAAGAFCSRPSVRGAITAVTAIGCPLVFSAGQVYPDVVAGVIILGPLARLLRAGTMPACQGPIVLAALAFLPWLQLKFSAPALVLAFALAWQRRREARQWAVSLLALVLTSVAVLLTFNVVNYGTLTGSYADGGLVANATAAMVLLGLLVDQNQGLLILNPILWLAPIGLVLLRRTRRSFAVIWTLVVASLLVPNAMHPNWYGGGSFIGRFALPASMACTIPAAKALAALHGRSPRVFWLAIAFGVLVQAFYWIWYALVSGIQPGLSSGLELYNKPAGTWLENYAVFSFPFDRFLPALYDSRWAYGYLPNVAWLAGLVAVVIAVGIVGKGTSPSRLWVFVGSGVFLGAVLISGLVSLPGARSLQEGAARLGSQTGTTDGDARIAQRGDAPGLLTIGPYALIRQGPYAIQVTYTSTAPPDVVVGRVELANEAGSVLRASEIKGTLGAVRDFEDLFSYRSLTPQVSEVRVAWYGIGSFVVDAVGIRNAQE